MKLSKLKAKLNGVFQEDNITDLCYNGLMLEGKEDVTRVLLAVSPSMAVIDYAVDNKFDAIITHHNLFRFNDHVVFEGLLKHKLYKLMINEISLFVYHAALDQNDRFGHAVVAGDMLKYDFIEYIVHPKHGIVGAIFDVKDIDCDVVEGKLNVIYGKQPISKYSEHNVSKLAILPGSGHRFLMNAIAQGANAVVSGTCDEPVWDLILFYKINFWCYGHHATEICGLKRMESFLSKDNLYAELFNDGNLF